MATKNVGCSQPIQHQNDATSLKLSPMSYSLYSGSKFQTRQLTSCFSVSYSCRRIGHVVDGGFIVPLQSSGNNSFKMFQIVQRKMSFLEIRKVSFQIDQCFLLLWNHEAALPFSNTVKTSLIATAATGINLFESIKVAGSPLPSK